MAQQRKFLLNNNHKQIGEMEKKNYVQPTTELVLVRVENQLLNASPVQPDQPDQPAGSRGEQPAWEDEN
ncbi:MAG: hypothetical protein II826_04575 [Prevotella sp.]|nr:hypothetical protein [Prevotella sp.]